MPNVCAVTGKRTTFGNNVSHAKNRTRRRFKANIHWHRFRDPETGRVIRLKVSARGIRIIAKKGLAQVLADIKAREAAERNASKALNKGEE